MKIGVSICPLFHNLEDIREISEIIFLREIGIKYIEIHTHFIDNLLEEFIKFSENFKITVSIHCPHMYFRIPTNFCSNEKTKSEYSEQWLKKSIKYAKQLNAKNIILHPDIPEKCTKKQALDILERHIKNNLQDLRENQKILIENMPGKKYALSTPEEFKEFLKRFKTNKVGVCWDIGHELQRYKDQKFRFPKILKDKIKEVHISGSKNFKDHLPLTQGDLKLNKCIKLLKSINFRGPIVFEIITNNPKDISESKDLLEKELKSN